MEAVEPAPGATLRVSIVARWNMSDTTEPSDEGKAVEYRRPRHVEKYGLKQHMMGFGTYASISWTGSARELIRRNIAEAWDGLEPRGVILPAFERNETVIQIRTFPGAKALYQEMTDELYRRRINQRQRNSIHNARDQLVEAFEEREMRLQNLAREHYNGHEFRSKGEVPRPSYPKDDIRLDADVEHQEFVRARAKYHLGHRPDDREVERVVSELPLMYGLDADTAGV